ncbi:MAG: hypothetical protein LBU79_09405, partial [Planctomycetota bacterium]|nr:hypothetical protein [Planctomycetota bacterium]
EPLARLADTPTLGCPEARKSIIDSLFGADYSAPIFCRPLRQKQLQEYPWRGGEEGLAYNQTKNPLKVVL